MHNSTLALKFYVKSSAASGPTTIGGSVTSAPTPVIVRLVDAGLRAPLFLSPTYYAAFLENATAVRYCCIVPIRRYSVMRAWVSKEKMLELVDGGRRSAFNTELDLKILGHEASANYDASWSLIEYLNLHDLCALSGSTHNSGRWRVELLCRTAAAPTEFMQTE